MGPGRSSAYGGKGRICTGLSPVNSWPSKTEPRVGSTSLMMLRPVVDCHSRIAFAHPFRGLARLQGE